VPRGMVLRGTPKTGRKDDFALGSLAPPRNLITRKDVCSQEDRSEGGEGSTPETVVGTQHFASWPETGEFRYRGENFAARKIQCG